MPDTITPTTSTDTTDSAEAEVPLHPDFVMPVPAPYETKLAREARAATAWWCDQIREQAHRAFPDEDQWLERACYPGPVPTVPLEQHKGSLWPPVLVERLQELRLIASKAAWQNRRFFGPPEIPEDGDDD
ncbi:hypothetical protein [Kitasatospora sp. NPDC004289]